MTSYLDAIWAGECEVRCEFFLINQGVKMILILRFFVNKYSVASIRRAPILVVVYLLLFSPECQSLNAQVLREVKTWERHKDEVFCLTISPDEKMIASGSADNTIWLWDLDSGKTRLTLDGIGGSAASLALTKDGKTLISASWEPAIQFWDVDTGKENHRIDKGGCFLRWLPTKSYWLTGSGR
jgi:WD40 repeat protein